MPYGQPFYTYTGGAYTPYQTPTYGSYQPQPQMPSMAQNQPLNGYQAQGQANTQPQPSLPTKTNVPLVTSLTEAMSRTTELNSDTFYADQDKPVIYRVSVDMQGRKTYKTFEITDVTEQAVEQSVQTVAPNIDLSAYATKEDLKALENKITTFAQSFGFNVPTMPTTSTAIPKPKKVEKADKTSIKTEVENVDTNKE